LVDLNKHGVSPSFCLVMTRNFASKQYPRP